VASSVIRIKIAVGILFGHAFSEKTKSVAKFPKNARPRPQKGVLTFADTFPAFWPSFGPFFVGPAVFRKASVLLDGFVGDVFQQISDLALQQFAQSRKVGPRNALPFSEVLESRFAQ
jgi:hypothetical protein